MGYCPVGFCPSGLLSQWAFVRSPALKPPLGEGEYPPLVLSPLSCLRHSMASSAGPLLNTQRRPCLPWRSTKEPSYQRDTSAKRLITTTTTTTTHRQQAKHSVKCMSHTTWHINPQIQFVDICWGHGISLTVFSHCGLDLRVKVEMLSDFSLQIMMQRSPLV